MIKDLIVAPIVIPLITTIIVFFAWRRVLLQRWITLIGSGCLLIAAVYLLIQTNQHHYIVTEMGNWPSPFGITLVSDALSSIMVTLAAIVGFCVSIYSFTDIDKRFAKGGFYPAYCILLAGLSGAFLTGDLFNLYVWFEVILISSFVLLALGAEKLQLEGAVKYAVLNLVATLIMLVAIAFLYGISGTLNMADLANHLALSKYFGLITTISIIFLVAFGIKAALFPLFFWLPSAYPTTSFSTSAIFAGLLSKVGVYALFRVFTLIFLKNQSYLHAIFLLVALFTLVLGILSAIAQKEMRRAFSFSLISHIGYMIIGLALLTPLAVIGSIFYLIQHVLVKTSLFLSSGVVSYFSGSTEMNKAGNLYQRHPYFAILFFIGICSLAGLPPFSGFWAKLVLVKATLAAHHYITTVVILLVSFLTLYMLIRIWQAVFLNTKEHFDERQAARELTIGQKICLLLPIAILTVLVLAIGIFPAPVYHFSMLTSNQLLHPMQYIHAVLGGGTQ